MLNHSVGMEKMHNYHYNIGVLSFKRKHQTQMHFLKFPLNAVGNAFVSREGCISFNCSTVAALLVSVPHPPLVELHKYEKYKVFKVLKLVCGEDAYLWVVAPCCTTRISFLPSGPARSVATLEAVAEEAQAETELVVEASLVQAVQLEDMPEETVLHLIHFVSFLWILYFYSYFVFCILYFIFCISISYFVQTVLEEMPEDKVLHLLHFLLHILSLFCICSFASLFTPISSLASHSSLSIQYLTQ